MEDIKILREKTGAGMVDCKKALEEAGGDMDKAVEILRKKGIAKAAKRGERETSEGIIKIDVSADDKTGYILELNSETDFVARNAQFQKFADNVLGVIKQYNPKDLEALLKLETEQGSIADNLSNLSGVIGEKLIIKRFAALKTSGTIGAYLHAGGRIGVLVSIDKPDQKELAYDIAMQVAAANPKYITPTDVPRAEIEKEKEIYREQLKKEGKPENIMEKIIEGKLNKFYEEVCLTKQEYIKDDKKKVEQVLGGVKVEQFIRYSL